MVAHGYHSATWLGRPQVEELNPQVAKLNLQIAELNLKHMDAFWQ